jgi:hypothetical protein
VTVPPSIADELTAREDFSYYQGYSSAGQGHGRDPEGP